MTATDNPTVTGDPAPGPAAPAGAAVTTAALTKRYGKLFAVRDLSLHVPAGSVFGLVGPNGAGKTTTFAVLASLLRPTSGAASVAGADPVRQPRKVRARVGYMPDTVGVYDNLRVDEYLRFFASAHGIRRRQQPALVDGLLELVDLTVKRDAMVNALSRGMKQRLSLARALVHDPDLLILDEPASGLDPRARVELRELVLELQAMGKTIIISSHILAELEEMCSHIAILEAGRLLVQGSPAEILEDLSSTRSVVVRLATGEVTRYPVADDAEQALLLHRLVVEEGLPVLEFREERQGLEHVFLAVTEGIVQ